MSRILNTIILLLTILPNCYSVDDSCDIGISTSSDNISARRMRLSQSCDSFLTPPPPSKMLNQLCNQSKNSSESNNTEGELPHQKNNSESHNASSDSEGMFAMDEEEPTTSRESVPVSNCEEIISSSEDLSDDSDSAGSNVSSATSSPTPSNNWLFSSIFNNIRSLMNVALYKESSSLFPEASQVSLSESIKARILTIDGQYKELEKSIIDCPFDQLGEKARFLAIVAFPDGYFNYQPDELAVIYKTLLGPNENNLNIEMVKDLKSMIDNGFKSLFSSGLVPFHGGTKYIEQLRCLGKDLCYQSLIILKALQEFKGTEKDACEMNKDRITIFFTMKGHEHASTSKLVKRASLL